MHGGNSYWCNGNMSWQVEFSITFTYHDVPLVGVSRQKWSCTLLPYMIWTLIKGNLNESGDPCNRLQNLSWYKTGFVSRQVLHLLSRLQNWICPITGQYKTCIVSNTKIEASIRATKPKTWQSHLTSDTVEIFIQNEKGRFSVVAKPFLVRQVKGRRKAGFGAAGLGSAQSRFWCDMFRIGIKPVLERLVQRRSKAGLVAGGLV